MPRSVGRCLKGVEGVAPTSSRTLIDASDCTHRQALPDCEPLPVVFCPTRFATSSRQTPRVKGRSFDHWVFTALEDGGECRNPF
jgi:hypothetical protein